MSEDLRPVFDRHDIDQMSIDDITSEVKKAKENRFNNLIARLEAMANENNNNLSQLEFPSSTGSAGPSMVGQLDCTDYGNRKACLGDAKCIWYANKSPKCNKRQRRRAPRRSPVQIKSDNCSNYEKRKICMADDKCIWYANKDTKCNLRQRKKRRRRTGMAKLLEHEINDITKRIKKLRELRRLKKEELRVMESR